MQIKNVCALSILVLSSIVITSCASYADSKLLDKESGLYEVSVRSYQECGGLWHGRNMCVENIKPQIFSLSTDICGKSPHTIRDCDERDGEDGREVYCLVECNAPPKVQQSTLRKARLCQERGGIWVDDRCELDLSQ